MVSPESSVTVVRARAKKSGAGDPSLFAETLHAVGPKGLGGLEAPSGRISDLPDILEPCPIFHPGLRPFCF
jgi:hypothetical protein